VKADIGERTTTSATLRYDLDIIIFAHFRSSQEQSILLGWLRIKFLTFIMLVYKKHNKSSKFPHWVCLCKLNYHERKSPNCLTGSMNYIRSAIHHLSSNSGQPYSRVIPNTQTQEPSIDPHLLLDRGALQVAESQKETDAQLRILGSIYLRYILQCA